MTDTLTHWRRDGNRRFFFAGHEPTKMREDQIVKAGIGRKFQTPSAFGSLSCFENVEVAAGFRDQFLRFFAPLSAARRAGIYDALARVGLTARTKITAAALSHGERQWLEIAMLLVQEPKLLLLDEPVAGMTGQERERTGELLHDLEGAHAIIVTEHDMDFVRHFARTVTVLHIWSAALRGQRRHGAGGCAARAGGLHRPNGIDGGPGFRMSVLTKLSALRTGAAATMPVPDDVFLATRELDIAYGRRVVVHKVSLDIEAGRVVCVMGRNGAGKTTLLKGIMGVLPVHFGMVRLGGVDVTNQPPYRRARRGVGYVPPGAWHLSLSVGP